VHSLVTPEPNFAACWTGDSIIYATRAGLMMVSENGGELTVLTSSSDNRDEFEHLGPSALPDGEHVLFTVAMGTRSRVAMLARSTGKWVKVIEDATSARYADGWLIYAQAGGIHRVLFDPLAPAGFDPLAPAGTGNSNPLRRNVFVAPCAGGGTAITHFDVSRDGTLAYAPSTGKPTRSAAYWVERDSEGIGKEIIGDPGDWKHPRLSPSQRQFAVDILLDSGVKDVHVYAFGQGFIGNLTRDGMSISSAFGADGPTVRSTHRRGLLREMTRAGARPLFPESKGVFYADCWCSDGNTLVGTKKLASRSSLFAFTRGDEQPKQLLDDKQSARFGQVSPDDRWLAYVADVQGRPEVWVRPFGAPGEPHRISLAGGGAPMWAKGTGELFYRTAVGTMIAATFETEPTFKLKTRTPLFPYNYDFDPGGHQHYDVTADSLRFIMIRNWTYAPNRIHVVANALDDAAASR